MKQDLEEMVQLYKQNPTEAQLNDIIVAMEPLIKYWAQSQCYLSWEREDLIQVARIAVVGALERFEPDKGIRFKTFAYRTVSGKLMNYYRDSTWRVSIPRKYRELSTRISRAEGEYLQTHGESPTIEQLADLLEVDSKEVKNAIEAKQATQTTSLSEQSDDDNASSSILDYVGAEDSGLEGIEVKKDLKEAMKILDDNAKKVIYYRYFEDLTQSKIAELLGISQMQVSRLEKSALQKIRDKMMLRADE